MYSASFCVILSCMSFFAWWILLTCLSFICFKDSSASLSLPWFSINLFSAASLSHFSFLCSFLVFIKVSTSKIFLNFSREISRCSESSIPSFIKLKKSADEGWRDAISERLLMNICSFLSSHSVLNLLLVAELFSAITFSVSIFLIFLFQALLNFMDFVV